MTSRCRISKSESPRSLNNAKELRGKFRLPSAATSGSDASSMECEYVYAPWICNPCDSRLVTFICKPLYQELPIDFVKAAWKNALLFAACTPGPPNQRLENCSTSGDVPEAMLAATTAGCGGLPSTTRNWWNP